MKPDELDSPLLVVNYPHEIRNANGLWQPFPFLVTLSAIVDEQVLALYVTVANNTLELTEIARRIAGTSELAKYDHYIEWGCTGLPRYFLRRLRNNGHLLGATHLSSSRNVYILR